MNTAHLRPLVSPPPSHEPEDPRVARALEEYEAALKAGRRPDRKAFLEALPDVAARIADYLDGLDFLHAAAVQLDIPAADTPPTGLGELGDFRLLREVGRGGMGVVYEAEQISLGRRVALKVLPFAATMDPRQRQRFHNEARAAASLHHPHIVPVHAVGVERGVHFYAMQFIDGQSLEGLIRDLRDSGQGTLPPLRNPLTTTTVEARTPIPETRDGTVAPATESTVDAALERTAESLPLRSAEDLRRVVGWGIQAAEALEHAHSLGIVHRDVKPANLLLDEQGQLWVADFGLARTGLDSGLTMTGDLLGTLRYMSPEQALAKHGLVDHRTDVYSLGVTLYELLTLQPAFTGTDRQELLRQIAFEEPRSARSLNRAIPADLETIVLKAMEKNPADRYATAQELADDLERFLADRPIRARRTTLAGHAWRWCRRNPALATLGGFAAAALVALAVGYAFVVQKSHFADQQAQTARRLGEEQGRTHAALKTAEEYRRQAEHSSAILVVQRGLTLCGQGDAARGMLWLARGLELAPAEAELRRDVRSALPGWRHQVHPLRAVFQHDGSVRAVALSPDGKTLLTGSEDHTARLWDVASGKMLGSLSHGGKAVSVDRRPDGSYQLIRHGNTVMAVAFSPDGKTVLTGGKDKAACLWDAATGKLIGAPMVHPDGVTAVAFSPDGKTVLTGCMDKAARLWDAATGKPLGEPLWHQDEVWSVAFGPGGRTVLTASCDRTVRLWEATTGKPIGLPLTHDDQVWSAAFSPDGGKILTGCEDGAARLWEAGTGKLLATMRHQAPVEAVAFSPTGKTVLTGSTDGSARLWEADTGQPLGAPLAHQGLVEAVAFSPDGRFVVTGSFDGTARLWEVGTGKLPGRVLHHPGPVWAGAFSPDGKVVATGQFDGHLLLWEAATGRSLNGRAPPARELPPPRPDQEVRAVACSPDGRIVVTGGRDGVVRLWDARTGRSLRVTMRHDGPVWAVAFSPDGTTVLTASFDKTARLWETATGKPVGGPLRHEESVYCAAFSPDGRQIVTGSFDKTARLWDTATGRFACMFMKHRGWIWAVAFSPDGQTVATASADGTALLWKREPPNNPLPPHQQPGDTRPFGAVPLVLQHQGPVRAVAFSPDGKVLATASEDWTAQLWEVASGKRLGPPLQHQGPVYSVAFSPDGKTLLTGSGDGTARLWTTATGRPLGTPLAHQGPVHVGAFSPDGKTILTGSWDRTACLWEPPTLVEGEVERLVLWVQVITGLELDADGVVRVLDASTWQQRRQRLQELGGPPEP